MRTGVGAGVERDAAGGDADEIEATLAALATGGGDATEEIGCAEDEDEDEEDEDEAGATLFLVDLCLGEVKPAFCSLLSGVDHLGQCLLGTINKSWRRKRKHKRLQGQSSGTGEQGSLIECKTPSRWYGS